MRSRFGLLGTTVERQTDEGPWFLISMAIGLLYALYFVLRYGGLWTENDTSVFTATTNALLSSHTVLFPGEYSHGFGYPAWLASLCLATGLSPLVVNSVIAPFIGVILFIVSGFTLYQRILRSKMYAAVALFVLYAVPELMFTVLRGNHEKLNVPYILLGLFAVIWSVDSIRDGRFKDVVVSSSLFYLCIFGNGVVNDYFGILTVVATLLVGFFIWASRKTRFSEHLLVDYQRRNFTVAVISLLVMLWVMVFLFPESGGDVSLLSLVLSKFTNLFVSVQGGANPYTLASQQWASPAINTILSLFHWMVLGASFLVFLLASIGRIWGRHAGEDEMIVWAIYFAFGTLVALAIPVDFFGLAAGSNLEVRNYTYFALVAAPPIAMGVRRFVSRSRLWLLSVGLLYCVMLLVGMQKATLDPAVSNSWLFYSPGEREALSTVLSRSVATGIWAGPDNRLPYVAASLNVPANGNEIVAYSYLETPYAVDFLWSPVEKAASQALRTVTPDFSRMNRIFDDGQAQIYRKAPGSYMQD